MFIGKGWKGNRSLPIDRVSGIVLRLEKRLQVAARGDCFVGGLVLQARLIGGRNVSRMVESNPIC